MLKLKPLISIYILIILMITACSAGSVTSRNVRLEMGRIKNSIVRDHDNIIKLKDRKIAKKGFFYVIDYSGRVVYHPQELLMGRNFSEYWFIKVILEEKNGCLSYNMGGNEHLIFYESINRSEILCYSIAADQLDEPAPRCKPVNREVEADETNIEGQ